MGVTFTLETITRKTAKRLNLDRYFTGKPCGWGHITERYTSNATCVGCQEKRRSQLTIEERTANAIYARAYRVKNPDKRGGDPNWSDIKRRQRLKNPEWWMWLTAKHRAKRFGILFQLTVKDIVIPDKCPVFNIPFTFDSDDRMCQTAPSLDRISNAEGYVPGNVRVISWRANRLKNDATIAELRAIIAYMENCEK